MDYFVQELSKQIQRMQEELNNATLLNAEKALVMDELRAQNRSARISAERRMNAAIAEVSACVRVCDQAGNRCSGSLLPTPLQVRGEADAALCQVRELQAKLDAAGAGSSTGSSNAGGGASEAAEAQQHEALEAAITRAESAEAAAARAQDAADGAVEAARAGVARVVEELTRERDEARHTAERLQSELEAQVTCKSKSKSQSSKI